MHEPEAQALRDAQLRFDRRNTIRRTSGQVSNLSATPIHRCNPSPERNRNDPYPLRPAKPFGQKITTLVAEKYYDPTFGGKDWKGIVAKHTPSVIQAESVEGFEAAVTDMLNEVHSSGMGLLGPTTKITPRSAINASFRKVETSADGSRWVFQDVLPGGVGVSRAGVQTRRCADFSRWQRHRVCTEPPAFPMGQRIPIVVSRNGVAGTEKRLDLATQDPKYKDNPYSEPTIVTAKDGGPTRSAL